MINEQVGQFKDEEIIDGVIIKGKLFKRVLSKKSKRTFYVCNGIYYSDLTNSGKCHKYITPKKSKKDD